MNEDICLHAICAYYEIYYPKVILLRLETILKDNALLSRRLQGIASSSGFNGLDYISLCDYQKRNVTHIDNPHYTSFDAYIKESLSLMFPIDKLSIVTPYVLNIVEQNKKGYHQMAYLGNLKEVRYSDLYDEIQVKDKIPLDSLCGITIPIRKMGNSFLSTDKNTQNIIKHLNKIRNLLTTYNHLVPIYDVESMTELTEEEEIKKIVKRYTKKI